MSNASPKLNFLRNSPLFLFLLPLFFVLHGFIENYDFVPPGDALLLCGIYLMTSSLLCLAGWLIYRSWLKASLLAFLLMAFHFFFGSIQDSLRSLVPGSFFTKYAFILPAASIFFVVLI